MRKLWYYLFYSLCAFTIAFSFYWMATMPPRSRTPARSASSGASSPALRAGNSLSGVPQEEEETEEEGYYLCDEGGRLAVYRCTADGVPRQRLKLTDIYVNLLPEQDAVRFKAGCLVWSRQELETLLEDLGA